MKFKLKGLTVAAAVIIMAAATAMPAAAQAQMRTVKGKVLDENGDPMPGVAVYDKNNISAGTATLENGTYSITVSSACKVLYFDFVGYKLLQIAPDKAGTVRMEPDQNVIQEIVVTGIYTRKKESFTGAVQSVNSEELRRAGNKNVFESLKNLDPSLLIMENLEAGSNPNTMKSMQLRGASSFEMSSTGLKSNFVSDTNMPLFILDGFETSLEKIQDMDMNRIQSITILKDASAKAIYGSKGGNGIIVIETKSLDSGRDAVVSYNGSVSLEMPDLTSYNLCNAVEKLAVEKREDYYVYGIPDSGLLLQMQELYYERLRTAMEGESTYWLSKPLRIGVGTKHSLGVELGNKELKSFTTVSYNNIQGAMKGSDRKVFSGDMSLSYRKGKWTVRNVMSISSMKSNESNYGSFSTYTEMNPYWNPYDSEGNLVRFFHNLFDSDLVANPLYDASLNVINSSNYLNFTDNLYVEFMPIEMLKIVARGGIDTKRTGADEFYPASHSNSFFASGNTTEYNILKGSYEQTFGNSTDWSGDVSAQFNHNVDGVHDIFATAQYNISSKNYYEVSHYAVGFPSSRLSEISFANSYDNVPSGTSGLNRNLGFLLTGGYSYANRYMADLTVKASASSVFGVKNRWGTFWSAGLAWNLHNEDFISDLGLFKQFKLRGSAGSSGNQNYTTNTSLPIYGYNTKVAYDGFTGAGVTNMENQDLGWEEKMDYNLGLDIRTKHLYVQLDAYIADTKNLVFSRSLPPSTGFKSVSDNMGKVRNKGIEAAVNYTVFQNRNSFLTFLGKAAINDNRILEISDAMRTYNEQMIQLAADSGSETPVTQYYDGMPLHSIWAVPSLGVDPVTGQEFYINKEGYLTNIWSASNLENCGSEDPLMNVNFGFNMEIKGIGASVIFTGFGGGYRYNQTLVDKVENASISRNLDRRIFTDRWYEPGQEAIFRNGSTGHLAGKQGRTKATSRFVQRNNTMDLSSVSLYYEMPFEKIRKLGMSRLRFSVYGSNLYTWSTIHIERGTSYPFARSVSFAVTATF